MLPRFDAARGGYPWFHPALDIRGQEAGVSREIILLANSWLIPSSCFLKGQNYPK